MKNGLPKSSSGSESSVSSEDEFYVGVHKKGSGNIVIPIFQGHSRLSSYNKLPVSAGVQMFVSDL